MMMGLEASNRLLEGKKFPKDQEERIVNNFRQYANWLQQQEETRRVFEEEKMKQEVEAKMKRSKKPEARRKKARK